MDSQLHSESEGTKTGGFSCPRLQVTVPSLLPQWNWAPSHATSLVMQVRLHLPAPHITSRLPHDAPRQRTLQS